MERELLNTFDKELLLKDICARLPHGVIALTEKGKGHICDINLTIFGAKIGVNINPTARDVFSINDIKPYLFPLSSMTDEMIEELNANGFFKYRDTIANVSHLISNGKITEEIYTYTDIESISYLIEFFHKRHIDYMGLIEKSLAIDATGKNVY